MTWTAFISFSLGIGLIETTIGPEKVPAGLVEMLVMYMGTLMPRSMWRREMPAAIKADSKVKLHPSKKENQVIPPELGYLLHLGRQLPVLIDSVLGHIEPQVGPWCRLLGLG